MWAELGLICLKYLDESGFEKCSPLSYGYARQGKQKQMHQPRKRGRRLSVLGFWQPQQYFEYGVMVGSVKSERYIQLMDWQAQKAAAHLSKTGQITVVIQDNASSHKSRLVQQHFWTWQAQGLYVFFLPPHSPQMNRIEEEWLHLKYDELAAQVFEDEYELALALFEAIEARGRRGGYPVERFKFNHV
ncbi:MAG: transposase [Chroococcidiopsidaceae cyanobacterium CP_BM_ER_R8_30]|nr:transposase [Chroococcidiopsidaceae cyanobacterium CP_BM_ER_R8_30]